MRAILVGLAVFLGGICPVLADGELPGLLTAVDKARLAAFDETKSQALAEARAKGEAADVKVLDEALAGKPLNLASGFDAEGPWRCRVIKAGGPVPLVVYSWFKCRISDDGSGWYLRKLSGSQLTEGRFYTVNDTKLVYLGAGYVAGEKPLHYGDKPDENQVAIVERLSDKRLVLEFPAPRYESKFDILVLER
jgi:hypothetical protein